MQAGLPFINQKEMREMAHFTLCSNCSIRVKEWRPNDTAVAGCRSGASGSADLEGLAHKLVLDELMELALLAPLQDLQALGLLLHHFR